MIKNISRVFLFLSLLLSLQGCAATVGQQFRDIMADIDAQCRKNKMGPYLDESDPESRRKRNITDCDILKIKAADPLATEEGRFAYSIQLPSPHNKPRAQYRTGMSAESYFRELCEKAEGDFVFRTIPNVIGIKIMRPIPKLTSVPLWEEAYGPPAAYFVGFNNGIYQYVDAVELMAGSQTEAGLIHYAIDPALPTKTPPWGLGSRLIEKSEARYGFTFRNSALENRELGILGKELIIFDLEKHEVLAVRRRFSQLNFVTKNSVQLMQGTPCRALQTKDSDNRFIATVLKPATKNVGDMK